MHECDDQWSWFVDCLPLGGLCDCSNFSVSFTLSLPVLHIPPFYSYINVHAHTHTFANRFHIIWAVVAHYSWVQMYSCRQQWKSVRRMWVAWNNSRKLAWIIEFNTFTINRRAETCITYRQRWHTHTQTIEKIQKRLFYRFKLDESFAGFHSSLKEFI